MLLRTAAVLSGLLGIALPLLAQHIVTGAAVDAGSGVPLPCLAVTLVDSAGRASAVTATDDRGLFEFASPPPSSHALRFRAVGRPPLDAPVVATSADTLRVYRLVFADSSPPDPTVVLQTERGKPRGADVDPVLVQRSTPRYPAGAQERRSEGTVVAHFVVGPDGRVVLKSRRVLASPDAELSGSILDYIASLRFRPARRGGTPACALMRQSYTFSLNH
jgi:TonB family protein